MIVLHRGKIIYEQYPYMNPSDRHITASIAKSFVGTVIANQSEKIQFSHYLKIHQKGETDYVTFCNHCAKTGIEKWVVDLDKMTCTYYDTSEREILVEKVPTV